MKDFYIFFGNLFNNYVVLIIVFCVLTKIVSIPLKLIASRQYKEKAVRDQHCKKLYSEYGSDKEKLTEKIYEYYKSSKYNPITFYTVKIIIIFINILLILLMVGTFKPISNFTNISESEKKQIVEIYEEQNEKTSTKLNYTEISLLNSLDDIKGPLVEAGISNQTINTLYSIKEKFTLGSVPMYAIPKLGALNAGSLVLFIALGASFAKVIPVLVNCIKRRKDFKTMGLSDKQKFIASPIISVLTFVLSISIIFNTPLVICFYFIFQYIYVLVFELIKVVCNYRKSKETSVQ